MRLNRRVPVGTHGGVRGRLSIHESLLLDFCKRQLEILSNGIHRYLIALCPGIAGDVFNGDLGIR